MLKKEDIYKIYDQYKKDTRYNILLPLEVLILSKKMDDIIAMIGHVEHRFFELYLNEDVFYYGKINNDYLVQILYHEFTHVADRLSYFKDEKDDKQHSKFLFPYTEFHASQIEMAKSLDLFSNSSKIITTTSKINDIDGIKTVKYFIDKEREDFSVMTKTAYENPCTYNIQKIIYMIVYNVGFYSVLRNFNIDNRLPVLSEYSFIQNELENIYKILLSQTPSEISCLQASAYAYKMTVKIAQNFGM